VPLGRPEDLAPETIVHRVGGGSVENLRLSLIDIQQTPPGISLLVGGTPQEAAAQMLSAFPGSRKWRETAHTAGTTTVAAVRETGFEVVPDPTARFPHHARLIHASGIAGFTDDHLTILAATFHNTMGW